MVGITVEPGEPHRVDRMGKGGFDVFVGGAMIYFLDEADAKRLARDILVRLGEPVVVGWDDGARCVVQPVTDELEGGCD